MKTDRRTALAKIGAIFSVGFLTKQAEAKTDDSDSKLSEFVKNNTDVAYQYAMISGEPFPEGEDAISKDSWLSYDYAKHIKKGRFRKGEKAIAEVSGCSYLYSLILEGPFPEGEDAIAESACWSANYAHDTLQGRFIKGEPAILKDPVYGPPYKERFLS